MTQYNTKLAILDMNDRAWNRGIDAITTIAQELGYTQIDRFDVRKEKQIPDLSYNVIVGSGGPGDPRDKGDWGGLFEDFIDSVRTHNQNDPDNKKFMFLICHSFQMACAHWKLGTPMPRDHGTLLGIHSQFVLDYAHDAPYDFIRNIQEPFQTFESRNYQICPNYEMFTEKQSEFLALTMRDKDNPALTSMISEDGAIIGTQFHPESTPQTVYKILTDTTDEKCIIAQNVIREKHGDNAIKHMLENVESLQPVCNWFQGFLQHARNFQHKLAA